jgi:hypothetical protein
MAKNAEDPAVMFWVMLWLVLHRARR